jgi:hypothetical protein
MHDVEEELRSGLRRLVAAAPDAPLPSVYERVVRRHRRRLAAVLVGAGIGLVAILGTAVAVPWFLSPETPRGPASPNSTIRAHSYLAPIVWVPPPDPPPDCHLPEQDQSACHESSSFTVTPRSGPPGTRFTVAGKGCPRSRTGRSLTVATLRSTGGGLYREGLRARPDGSFRVSETVSSTLVPHSYLIRVFCSGRPVEGYRTFTVVKPGPGGPDRGRPDGGGFTASADRRADGKLQVRLSGTGCFLPQLDGMPGGKVTFVVTKPDMPFTGYTPAFGEGFGLQWVARDGTWTSGTGAIPGRGTRDIHAFCLDSMDRPGFKYARVYRLDGDRLTEVTP